MITPARPLLTLCTIAAALVLGAGAASAQSPGERPPPPDVPGPLVGAIEITNERDRAVQIYLDGRFAIELRARSTETLERVPNGIRLVSYAGMGRGEGARWQTDRVEVREGRRAALRIAPLRGQVAVVNQSGIAMRVTLGELDLGVVEPGREAISPPLLAGRTRLAAIAVGWTRAAPQTQDVIVEAGEIVRAELRPFAATLVVSNPFPTRVEVWIDGRRAAKLGRMESERIAGLEPGRVRVEIREDERGHRAGQLLAQDLLELVPGRETYFAPQLVRFGSLDVRNPTQEPVRVTIGRDDGFRLMPGQRRVVTDLEPGPLTIQLTTDDGRIVRHEARIEPGATSVFEIPRAWVSGGEPVPVRPPPR